MLYSSKLLLTGLKIEIVILGDSTLSEVLLVGLQRHLRRVLPPGLVQHVHLGRLVPQLPDQDLAGLLRQLYRCENERILLINSWVMLKIIIDI